MSLKVESAQKTLVHVGETNLVHDDQPVVGSFEFPDTLETQNIATTAPLVKGSTKPSYWLQFSEWFFKAPQPLKFFTGALGVCLDVCLFIPKLVVAVVINVLGRKQILTDDFDI